MTAAYKLERPDRPGALILKLGQTAKGSKVCRTCGRTRPLSEFPRNRNSITGIAHQCDDCDAERRARAGRKRSAASAIQRETLRVSPKVRPPGPETAARLRHLIIDMRIHALDHYDPAAAEFATRLETILNG